MEIFRDALNTAFDKLMDPNAKHDYPPTISREDALRVGKQLLEGKLITVNGEVFIPDVKEWKATPDKDLYFVLFSADGTRSIEMALYKGADTSEFNYSTGGPTIYQGQKIESLLDADNTPITLVHHEHPAM